MLTCIFGCTVSKNLPPQDDLLMRNYAHLLPNPAAHVWKHELQKAEETTSIARLYKGGYWSVAKATVRDATFPIRGMVASAGVGLRDFTEKVPSYAATFNAGERDLIPGGDFPSNRRHWWKALGGRDRLLALAEHPDARVAVAVPGIYLDVLMKDLEDLQAEIGPRALSVFTTNELAVDRLGMSAVPLQARMSRVLGGTAGQLTVRALAHVLSELRHPDALTPGRARAVLDDVLAQAPESLYPKRQKQSEEQVRQWVTAALLSDNPPTSATGALRRFRGEGLGFEQKRFSKLFKAVRQSLSEERHVGTPGESDVTEAQGEVA